MSESSICRICSRLCFSLTPHAERISVNETRSVYRFRMEFENQETDMSGIQNFKGQFEQEHGAELALYEAAARYLEKLKSGGEALTPKKWRAESEKLTAQKEIYYSCKQS